jgi:hypothetical protein
VHEEKICSLLKRLEATLTDNRTGTTVVKKAASGFDDMVRFVEHW